MKRRSIDNNGVADPPVVPGANGPRCADRAENVMSSARGIVFEAASGTPPNVPKAPLKTHSGNLFAFTPCR